MIFLRDYKNKVKVKEWIRSKLIWIWIFLLKKKKRQIKLMIKQENLTKFMYI